MWMVWYKRKSSRVSSSSKPAASVILHKYHQQFGIKLAVSMFCAFHTYGVLGLWQGPDDHNLSCLHSKSNADGAILKQSMQCL